MKKLILRLLFSLFLLSMVGCSSQSNTKEASEEMITLTLIPQFVPDITDEWLDTNIGTYYHSFERQDDDSVVLKMTTEQYDNYIDYIRSGIISATQSMVANDHNNVTDISFNDNFSDFQITVKTDALYRSDADSAYYMFTAYGRFYQYLTTGLEDCSVTFTYLDADGNILQEDYISE